MSDTTQLPAFIGALDRASEWFGRTLAWLIIIMMLIQFAIVLLRYMFSINSIFMQELVMYMHASVFMRGERQLPREWRRAARAAQSNAIYREADWARAAL